MSATRSIRVSGHASASRLGLELSAPSGRARRPRRVEQVDRGEVPLGHDLAGRAAQGVGEREPAELEHERPEVAGVEQLDPDVGVELADPAQLAVLLADELLAEGRHLEVELEVRQPEVRREALDDGPVEVPQDRERVRLVLPADPVEVEDPGHLGLAGVGEGRARPVRRGDRVERQAARAAAARGTSEAPPPVGAQSRARSPGRGRRCGRAAPAAAAGVRAGRRAGRHRPGPAAGGSDRSDERREPAAGQQVVDEVEVGGADREGLAEALPSPGPNSP